jgi:ABC-2 type transport system permease protein
MRYLRLIGQFVRASAQGDLAYRANFFISLLHSLLNLGVGVASVLVLPWDRVGAINGWDQRGLLTLLGIYLIVSALRGLCLGPSLDALAGMDGEVWSGRLDFTLLRPVDTQFLASFRQWRLFTVTDLLLGLGVLGVALAQPGHPITAARLAAFAIALAAGLTILYALLLAFTALIFWSPGFLFTWLFDGIFQMARYPVGLYPGWLRLALTWIVPVGLMTTVPAQALTGDLPPGTLIGSSALAVALLLAASVFFRVGLRRYASASS